MSLLFRYVQLPRLDPSSLARYLEARDERHRGFRGMTFKAGLRDVSALSLLALSAIFLQGYHYGFEDQAIWLPAIKKSLNSSLYPHDSIFFLAQTRFSLFPEMIAFFIKFTSLPTDICVFLGHLFSIFLVLLACLKLAGHCFPNPYAQWAAVATIWIARLTPVAGPHLNLMDRYLHPRDLATGLLLFALVAVLSRSFTALIWIALAVVLHPTMAAFGAFHLAIQAWKQPRKPWTFLIAVFGALLLFVSVFYFKPVPNPAWHEILSSRPYLFPLKWPWYFWICTAAVFITLHWITRIARRRELPVVQHLTRRIVISGITGILVAVLITTVPAFERFIPAEPMRTLHLVYFLLVFLGGGLFGETLLQNHPLRWFVFLLSISLVFFIGNKIVYSSSPYVEMPGHLPRNAWIEAFDWIRQNTPNDALFALDPNYMTRPGEDHHGFRAFAERSALADWVKDRSVSVLEPQLAYRWLDEERDIDNWQHFTMDDFHRLKQKHGVDWVVLERERNPSLQTAGGLSCPYSDTKVLVCKLP
jgi:hypothetical protein